MRVIIVLLSVLFLVPNIYAQRIQHLKKGNNFYKDKDYVSAVSEYEKLWNSSAGAKLLGVDAKMNLANCYRVMEDPFRAQELYVQIMRYAEDRLPVYLQYGKVLMSLGQYEAAVKQFQLYAQKDIESIEPAELIKQCRDIEEIESLFADVEVTNQSGVNDSTSRQIGVTYYGDALVFASDELGDELGDLRTRGYLNMRACGLDTEGNLKPSEKFSHSLNGLERHDGPATFTRDGVQVFYSQSVTTRQGASVLQIWQSFFRNGQWSEPKPMPFMVTGANFTHPTLSPDSRTLYFASDMKGSFGGLDVWETHLEDGHWTNPHNLGKDINTEKDDAWPFIHPDGDLYFSSKGHPGFGGYDIFRTRPLGNGVDWLEIENMGQPFNSSFSDVSFIMADNQTEGFMASNRSRSYDIFRYVIPGAEKQSLPADVSPRKSTGLSEIEHEYILDTNFPEQPDGMTDVEYVEHLKALAEEGKLNLPLPEGEDPNNVNSNGVDNSLDQNTARTATNDNSGNASTADNTSTNSMDDNSVNTNTETTNQEIVLAVVLKVMDVTNSRPLPEAKVVVKNKFTQKEQYLLVNDRGEVEVVLEIDQKYTLTGQCEGYKETSLPVSTMGVSESDRVQANMPLEKE
jgi:hypothetical protein